MQVLYSPLFSEETIKYAFYKDTVKASYKADTVFFDFRGVEVGKSYSLSHELVLGVHRDESGIVLTLVDYVTDDCPQERKFPELSTVTESEFELGDEVIKPILIEDIAVVDEVTELKEQITLLEACLMEVASVIYD